MGTRSMQRLKKKIERYMTLTILTILAVGVWTFVFEYKAGEELWVADSANEEQELTSKE